MLRTEVERLVEIAKGEEAEISIDTIARVIEEVNAFAETPLITADDLANASDFDEVKDRVFSLLSGKIETLRDTGTEEEFAEFERRLTLASIDELWMNHIDSMAHLREEVAFEGYAQKNPLIIYKERAYDKFVVLINTIGLRVTK
jgi:preprotein translocase subunit SecA